MRHEAFNRLISSYEDARYPLSTTHPVFSNMRGWLVSFAGRPLTKREFMRTQFGFRGHVVVTPLCPEYLSGEVFSRGLLAEMVPQIQRIFCDYFEALDWDDDPVE